jgi:hypothetical protein
MDEVDFENIDDLRPRRSRRVSKTFYYCLLFIICLVVFYVSDLIGFRPISDSRQFEQIADFVDSPKGVRTTFVQFERPCQRRQISVIYVRYVLNSTTFSAINFTSLYSVKLMNDAEEVRTYSLTDKSITLTANSTRFVRLLRISNVEFDTLTLKIESHNLGPSSPTVVAVLSIRPDVRAIRRSDCHLVFMIGSGVALVSLLLWWKTRLRKARAALCMLFLGILAHQSVTDFGFPQYIAVVEVVAAHVHRGCVRATFGSISQRSVAFLLLVAVELFVGVWLDVTWLNKGANTTGVLVGWVALLVGQVAVVHGRVAVLGVLGMAVGEVVAMYECRTGNPGIWVMALLVVPDLCAWCYAGLALDFDELVDVEGLFGSTHRYNKTNCLIEDVS